MRRLSLAAQTMAGLALVLMMSTGSLSAAAAPAQQASPAPGDARLNGFWIIDAIARAKSMAGVHPEYTDAGQALAKRYADAAAERISKGEWVALAAATCGYIGTPFWYSTSEPFLLAIGKGAIVQTFERYQLWPRHFYTDGRPWPDMAKMPLSSSGYSVAHWEGKTLVIETRGLPERATPGSPARGPNTVLTERASLNPAGNRLTWSFTFTDPDLLAKPYTFAVDYDRTPPHTYAFMQTCDPNTDISRLVAEPPQDGAAK